MKILVATHNPGKLGELRKGLSHLEKKNVKIISLKDLGISESPQETGQTFQENSLLKSKFYAQLSGLPTIADDGGLGIDILKGQPGVKSRRWPGYEATDEELIDFTLGHLRGVFGAKRSAYLQTCITFYDPRTKTVFSETEKIDGYIAEKQSGRPTEGYPFRALFIVQKFNQPRSNRGKYYDELTEKEHEVINHRLKAIKRLSKKIEKYMLE